jgi:hypothetical protein
MSRTVRATTSSTLFQVFQRHDHPPGVGHVVRGRIVFELFFHLAHLFSHVRGRHGARLEKHFDAECDEEDGSGP